jgi:tripartite-type tricarboxylate transporter receptor subunit TctC
LKSNFLSRAAALLLGAACVLPASVALAQGNAAWPQKPVRFIIPFPPGSGTDVMARVLAQKLSEKWGQPVLVDNRPGASGVIGMQAVLASPADGYTFSFAQGSAISVAPSTIKSATYDYKRDFVPVGMVATSPFLISVAAETPYKTVEDLVRAAKAKPLSVEIADNGRATLPHLAAAALGVASGAEFMHVHYQGGAQAMQATIAGETKAQVEPMMTIFGMVQGGRMRVLASMSDRVEPGLEAYPLVAKTYPGVTGQGWFAVLAKKGVEDSILQKANADLNEALGRPDVIAKYREFAAYVRPGTPADLSKYIADDTKKWAAVIDKLGIKPE